MQTAVLLSQIDVQTAVSSSDNHLKLDNASIQTKGNAKKTSFKQSFKYRMVDCGMGAK